MSAEGQDEVAGLNIRHSAELAFAAGQVVIAILVATLALLDLWRPAALSGLHDWLGAHGAVRGLLYALAAAWLLWALWHFWERLSDPRSSGALVVPSGSGEVAVTLKALTETLRRTAEALAEVEDVGVSLALRDGADGRGTRLLVQVQYVTREGTCATELHERLSQLMRARLEEIVTLPVAPVIRVRLDRILARGEKTPRRRRRRAEEEVPPFTGPQYPF